MGFHNEIARHFYSMGSASEIDMLSNFAMELHAKSCAGSNPRGQVFVRNFRFSAAAARRAPEPRSGLLQLLVLRLRSREAGARIADRRVGLFCLHRTFGGVPCTSQPCFK